MSKPTNVSDFISNLGAGVTEQIISKVLSDAAVAVLVLDGKKSADVKLELKLSKMSEDSDVGVKIDAKVSYKIPTKRGDKTENETRESVFFLDPQKGLVDTPPKRKEEFQNDSMASGMPAGINMRGS